MDAIFKSYNDSCIFEFFMNNILKEMKAVNNYGRELS